MTGIPRRNALTRLAASSGAGLIGLMPDGASGLLSEATVQSKPRDGVSVFDFFAPAEISDVIARTASIDVASKINAAITSMSLAGRKGGALFFPAGKYRIDSSINLNEDSVQLIGDGYGEPGALSHTEIFKNFNGIAVNVSDAARRGQQLRWGISGLNVNGNDNTGDGIYVNDAHYGFIENVVSHNNKGTGAGIHFHYAYSNTLNNVQSIRNYRNFTFENKSHDILGTKCYSSSATAEGFYITTSNALSFYGSTHEGMGTVGIWINRLTKGVTFDGVYLEALGGANYTSCIRISEDTTESYSVRNTALKNIHIRINKAYIIPILLRAGIKGAVVENVNVEFNGLVIDTNSKCVFVGWGAGATAVTGVRVANVHADLVNCTGAGLQVVSAAANVVDGGVEVVGCSCYGDTLRIGVGGQHHCRNAGAENGNHLAAVDFASLKINTAAPPYTKSGSLVYADGSAWNPSGTGEGLHILKVGGTYRRIAEHTSSTTAARPLTGVFIGMQVFDTTLSKPVWARTVGTKESATITVTAGARASGNITVTLNGVATTVAVVAGDTATQVGDKIVAKAFSGWTTSRTARAGVVAITKATTGTNTAPAFTDAGATGVRASIVVTTAGTATVWVDAIGTTV